MEHKEALTSVETHELLKDEFVFIDKGGKKETKI